MKASKRDFTELLSSNAWKEILSVLIARLEDVRDELENPTLDERLLRINQGRAEELRFAADLPSELLKAWDRINKEEQNAYEEDGSKV